MSTAIFELGPPFDLKQPRESSDGDLDRFFDINGTAISCEKEIYADCDPGFIALDEKAFQFVYGSEMCVSTKVLKLTCSGGEVLIASSSG